MSYIDDLRQISDKIADLLQAKTQEFVKKDVRKNQVDRFSLSKYTDYQAINNLINQLLQSGLQSQELSYLTKYSIYRSMMRAVPQLEQALEIYTDNILSPDDVSKRSIVVVPWDKSYVGPEQQFVATILRHLLRASGIEDKLDTITFKMLALGRAYLEIRTAENIWDFANDIYRGSTLQAFKAFKSSADTLLQLKKEGISEYTDLQRYNETINTVLTNSLETSVDVINGVETALNGNTKLEANQSNSIELVTEEYLYTSNKEVISAKEAFQMALVKSYNSDRSDTDMLFYGIKVTDIKGAKSVGNQYLENLSNTEFLLQFDPSNTVSDVLYKLSEQNKIKKTELPPILSDDASYSKLQTRHAFLKLREQIQEILRERSLEKVNGDPKQSDFGKLSSARELIQSVKEQDDLADSTQQERKKYSDEEISSDIKQQIADQLAGKKSIQDLSDEQLVKLLNSIDEILGNVNNVYIRVYDPSRVIPINIGSLVVGYLIVDAIHLKPEQPIDPQQIFGMGGSQFGDTNLVNARVTVAKNLVSKLVSVLAGDENTAKALLANNKFVRSLSELLLFSSASGSKRIFLRYVKPDDIIEFIDDSDDTQEGKSRLDGLELTTRLYFLNLVATTIYRLARAPEKRIFWVETEGLSTDVYTTLENTLRAIKRKTFTLNMSGSLDTLISYLGTFDDIFAVMRDGKRLIEFDTLQGGSLADKVEDINILRKQLLSGLGVPPGLLGYSEELETRATLTQQNIRFARSVVRRQRYISRGLTKFMYKLAYLCAPALVPEVTQYIATVPAPRALAMERLSELINNVGNIISTLQNIGISDATTIIRNLLGDIFEDIDFDMSTALKSIQDSLTELAGEEGGGGF